MKDLIKALQIFLKYKNSKWPTHCEHDVLYVVDINPQKVSKEDKEQLEELGFFPDEENEGFMSFRFGGA
jgi:hypothetical protein